jgi:lipopolysaccharide/colanic/teichoic acid biosynthesis glycosyltransferase
MGLNTSTLDAPELKSRLLLLGFDPGTSTEMQAFSPDAYLCFAENNSFKAFLWLEQQIDGLVPQLPYAIFCRMDWLLQDDFKLPRQIMAHPQLRHIPIVALADSQADCAPVEILTRNGIDDCYVGPLDWSVLEARLRFLHQYKPRLLNFAGQTLQQDFQFKIHPLKRLFDVVGASLGLLFSAPIWVPTMLAIRLESPGPILYRSKRVGTGYHVFDFLKFRSMYRDADQRLHEFRHLNQYADGTQNVFVKFANDPRITRVGRFIRKYSIDELPQLLNVLRGDMSLVGNRPLPLYEAEMLTNDEWSTRFMAPAGITGLWQVTKRGQSNMSTEDRIQLDIAYARNYTVWDDLKIMRQTFGAFIQHEDV